MDFKEEYLEKMVDFSKRNNKKESIVGWFMASNGEVNVFDNSFIRSINSIFVKYCMRTPIHLVVTVGADELLHYCGYIGKNITNCFTEAYWNNRNPKTVAAPAAATTTATTSNSSSSTSNSASASSSSSAAPASSVAAPASAPETQFSFMFESLNVEVAISDSEAACLHHMVHDQTGSGAFTSSQISAVVPDSSTAVTSALEQMLRVIDKLDNYVSGVVEGSKAPISDVGMALSDVIGSMEAVSRESVEETYRDRLHEMLMVSYLSSLTKAQLQIADKIDTIL